MDVFAGKFPAVSKILGKQLPTKALAGYQITEEKRRILVAISSNNVVVEVVESNNAEKRSEQ